uniref:Uncharacterized protein n=1 Tax=Lotus japonicus TaxID=34305 RepID=I3T8K7_LOTJA|nr:unknown [Lotus japonicus]
MEGLSWLVEHRETEIGGHHLSIFARGIKQEILRLKIPMNNPKRVTSLHNPHNSLNQFGSLSLTIMPLLNNPIKKLTTSTKLHDQMHKHRILIGPLNLNHIRMLRQMAHDLNLPPHIIIILLA